MDDPKKQNEKHNYLPEMEVFVFLFFKRWDINKSHKENVTCCCPDTICLHRSHQTILHVKGINGPFP